MPWQEEYQLANKEPDYQYDESIKNDILELANYIDSIMTSEINIA